MDESKTPSLESVPSSTSTISGKSESETDSVDESKTTLPKSSWTRGPTRLDDQFNTHLNKMISLCLDLEGEEWKYFDTRDGITIHKKRCGTLDAIRGAGVIKFPILKVLKLLGDFETRKKWDDMFDGGLIVEMLNDCSDIIHMKFGSPNTWVVSGRDLVMARCVRMLPGNTKDVYSPDSAFCTKKAEVIPPKPLRGNLEDLRSDCCYIACSFSVEHEKVPANAPYVRAHSHNSGMFVAPGEGDTTHVVYVTHIDLRGLIPAFIMNKVAVNVPTIIRKVEKVLEQTHGKSQ